MQDIWEPSELERLAGKFREVAELPAYKESLGQLLLDGYEKCIRDVEVASTVEEMFKAQGQLQAFRYIITRMDDTILLGTRAHSLRMEKIQDQIVKGEIKDERGSNT